MQLFKYISICLLFIVTSSGCNLLGVTSSSVDTPASDASASSDANSSAVSLVVHSGLPAKFSLVSSFDQSANKASIGSWSPKISADGNYITFLSSTNILSPYTGSGYSSQVFLKSMNDLTLAPQMLSVNESGVPSNAGGVISNGAEISGDGDSVIFTSNASNLIAGSNSYSGYGLYKKSKSNLSQAAIILNSKDSSFANISDMTSNGLSQNADGRYVAFISNATNLISGTAMAGSGYPSTQVFYRDLNHPTQAPLLISSLDGTVATKSDGGYISCFTCSPYDGKTATSANGRYVFFSMSLNGETSLTGSSYSGILIFKKDTLNMSNPPVLVSSSDSTVANAYSEISAYELSISADGRYVVFVANDGNGYRQVMMKDTLHINNPAVVVSNSFDGSNAGYGNQPSSAPKISADGNYIAFTSNATNLVDGFHISQSGTRVYRKDIQNLSDPPILVSAKNELPANALGSQSYAPDLNADGSLIVFQSTASNLINGANASGEQIFLWRESPELSAGPANLKIYETLVSKTAVGENSVSTIEVKNFGSTTATLSSRSLELGAPYSIKGGTCAAASTLASGASCTVEVKFSPKTVGTFKDNLSVNYNDGTNNQSSIITLSGVGYIPIRELTITQSNFNSVGSNLQTSATFNVVNTGDAFTAITWISIDDGSNFTINGGSCGIATILTVGSSCTINVTFNPNNVVGTMTDLIKVSYFGGTGSVTRSLSAVSVTPSLGSLSGTGSGSINDTAIGASNYSSVIYYVNNGDLPVTIGNYGTGLVGSEFSISSSTCTNGTVIAHGNTCNITLVFTPSSVGSKNVTFSFDYNDGQTVQTISQAYSGTGLPAAAGVLYLSSSDFPSSPLVGNDYYAHYTFTNSGNASLTINTYGSNLSGTDFSYNTTNYAGSVIAPGASLTFPIYFTPTSAGARNVIFDINYNDGNTTQVLNTSISITAVVPAIFSIGAVTFTDQLSGSRSDSVDLVVTNTGGSTGNITNAYLLSGIDFALTGGDCTQGLQLKEGETCKIRVALAPSSTGVKSDSIRINYWDGFSNTSGVQSLSGTGISGANHISAASSIVSPTGWLDSAGNPISISVVDNAPATPKTIECRTGPANKIESVSFADCNLVGGIYYPAQYLSQDNGSYISQVRAVESSVVVDQIDFSYYIHPSLNAIAKCAQTKTDAEYFTAAGQYLRQTTSFGDDTKIGTPKSIITFKGYNDGKTVTNLSLRKTFVENNSKTMMLLKRNFKGQGNKCTISTHNKNYKTSGYTRATAATQADQSLQELEHYSIKKTGNGLIPMANAYVNGVKSWMNSETNSSVTTGGKIWDYYINNGGDASTSTPVTIDLRKMDSHSLDRCDAVVFNAEGKGVCFIGGVASDFAHKWPAQLRGNTNQMFGRSHAFSPKFEKNSNKGEDNFNDAVSNHPGVNNIYLLED